MNVFAADLHIHTDLSPCGSEEMTPPAIVQAALERGLAMIAICDHNSARNTAATQEAAGPDLAVLAGMEVTSAEEVHVVGLFPDAATAQAAAEEVGATLPEADLAYERWFGAQHVLDAAGAIVGAESRMLGTASRLALSDVVELIHRHQGVAAAAHVNRPSFSVFSQLGMFPTTAGFDAIELFSAPNVPSRAAEFTQYGLPLLTSSDSHYLADVGRTCTQVTMAAPTFDELVQALRGTDGRGVACA